MVYQELKNQMLNEINKIEIINPHTHLREDDLTSHVVDILSYHWVLSELNSVGMDYDEVFTNKEYDLDTRLKAAVPYLQRMKNTATYRCIKYIFEDLYDFHDDLTLDNYKELLEISLERTARPMWPTEVFNKANISTLMTGCGNASKKGNERDNFYLMAELNYICWPAGSTDNEPWFVEYAHDETRYLEAIEHVGGIEIKTPQDIVECMNTFLRDTLQGRCKVFATYLPIEFRFEPIDDGDVQKAIDNFRFLEGKSSKDLDVLVKYTTWKMLEIMNDIQTTLQIAVGAEYFICGGRSISRFSDTWVSDMVKVFHKFPNVKFDIMNASQAMNHEMEVAAKMFRNFYLQNMWWHTYVPSCIKSINEKLEIVPAVKLGGFYCDAYYCELTYGKLQMVKDSLASVFADKIAEGIYTETEAIEILNMLLNLNPKELYNLN